jgi:glutathione peroxidase
MSIYKLSVVNAEGKKVKLEKYKGKTLLVVNIATKCGLATQLDGLQKLHSKYEKKGLVILGFPCNQFMFQNPEDAKATIEACSLKYGVDFQILDKINVNGNDADPLYKYLKDEIPGPSGKAIKWNYTKFLISKQGNVVSRFEPSSEPLSFEKEIKAIL